MTIAKKTIIRNNEVIEVRITSTNWQGTRFELTENGHPKAIGGEELIWKLYNAM